MLYTLNTPSWRAAFSTEVQKQAVDLLEDGQVIHLPHLPFHLYGPEERALLRATGWAIRSKNISLDPKGVKLKQRFVFGEEAIFLTNMMLRFFMDSRALVGALFPAYQPFLMDGRTSYRPFEIAGRKSSILKDDTRLHIDAFPATPNQGKRILRVFTNINANQQSRHWQIGDPFKRVVERFLSQLRPPIWGGRKMLSLLKITKSYRTLYDHYMLMLHNQMKLDQTYQKSVKKVDVQFLPGDTWIVMTDQVSHAALSGQFALEQTFYLPVHRMVNPSKSPLFVLEQAVGMPLVKPFIDRQQSVR